MFIIGYIAHYEFFSLELDGDWTRSETLYLTFLDPGFRFNSLSLVLVKPRRAKTSLLFVLSASVIWCSSALLFLIFPCLMEWGQNGCAGWNVFTWSRPELIPKYLRSLDSNIEARILSTPINNYYLCRKKKTFKLVHPTYMGHCVNLSGQRSEKSKKKKKSPKKSRMKAIDDPAYIKHQRILKLQVHNHLLSGQVIENRSALQNSSAGFLPASPPSNEILFMSLGSQKILEFILPHTKNKNSSPRT